MMASTGIAYTDIKSGELVMTTGESIVIGNKEFAVLSKPDVGGKRPDGGLYIGVAMKDSYEKDGHVWVDFMIQGVL